MNRQGPGKIGWTDWTWNMLRGPCPVACWYCHARRRYHQFGIYKTPKFIINELLEPPKKKPAKIFTCSTFELFHPSVLPGMRDAIFKVIEECPQHTFQILTKLPQNIDRPMPDNVWLGITVEGDIKSSNRELIFRDIKAAVKFISFEPILKENVDNSLICYFNYNWLIIGRLTGYGRIFNPPIKYLEMLVDYARVRQVPIFMKDSLQGIWGEKLIQEWPNEN